MKDSVITAHLSRLVTDAKRLEIEVRGQRNSIIDLTQGEKADLLQLEESLHKVHTLLTMELSRWN